MGSGVPERQVVRGLWVMLVVCLLALSGVGQTCDEVNGVFRESIEVSGLTFDLEVSYNTDPTQVCSDPDYPEITWDCGPKGQRTISLDASGSYQFVSIGSDGIDIIYCFELDGPGDLGEAAPGVSIPIYRISYTFSELGSYWWLSVQSVEYNYPGSPTSRWRCVTRASGGDEFDDPAPPSSGWIDCNVSYLW